MAGLPHQTLRLQLLTHVPNISTSFSAGYIWSSRVAELADRKSAFVINPFHLIASLSPRPLLLKAFVAVGVFPHPRVKVEITLGLQLHNLVFKLENVEEMNLLRLTQGCPQQGPSYSRIWAKQTFAVLVSPPPHPTPF